MRISDWSSDVCSSDLPRLLTTIERIDELARQDAAVDRAPRQIARFRRLVDQRLGIHRPQRGDIGGAALLLPRPTRRRGGLAADKSTAERSGGKGSVRSG